MKAEECKVQIKYEAYQGVVYVTCDENDEVDHIIAKARRLAGCNFLSMAYFSAKILEREVLK